MMNQDKHTNWCFIILQQSVHIDRTKYPTIAYDKTIELYFSKGSSWIGNAWFSLRNSDIVKVDMRGPLIYVHVFQEQNNQDY